MANDPGVGYKIKATVIGAKGDCEAGHRMGDSFEVSMHNPSEMCGMLYHQIFPSLATLQFGGSFDWWQNNVVMASCSDPMNTITMKLERVEDEQAA